MEDCPAYAIARNRQLAELVMKAPKTLAALKEIEGCGESFAKQYGDTVLHMLAEVRPGEGPAPSEGSSMTDVSEEDTKNK